MLYKGLVCEKNIKFRNNEGFSVFRKQYNRSGIWNFKRSLNSNKIMEANEEIWQCRERKLHLKLGKILIELVEL